MVDKFVLVEATRTFQKKPKPLYFAENRQRYGEFENKIIHIVIEEFPGFFYKWRIPKAWDYSNYQKDQVVRGLEDCKKSDTIIFLDIDEIPRAEKLKEAVKLDAWEHASEKKYNPAHLMEPANLQEVIESDNDLFDRGFDFAFVELEDDLPRYVLDNVDKFKHLVK